MSFQVQRIPTTPFEGQKPGTSGLRKAVAVFQQPKYTENFVEATLIAGLGDKLKGSTLLVGGDGRYFLNEAVQIIIKIAAAKGVRVAQILKCWQEKGSIVIGVLLPFGIRHGTSGFSCCPVYYSN